MKTIRRLAPLFIVFCVSCSGQSTPKGNMPLVTAVDGRLHLHFSEPCKSGFWVRDDNTHTGERIEVFVPYYTKVQDLYVHFLPQEGSHIKYVVLGGMARSMCLVAHYRVIEGEIQVFYPCEGRL